MHSEFAKIGSIDIAPLMLEVSSQPFLWDKNPLWLSKWGPHHEMQTLVIRTRDESEFVQSGRWSEFADAGFNDWYLTSDYIPSAREIALDIMAKVRGEHLGGILIFKVEPGRQVFTHSDKAWASEFYDKYSVCLQSNPRAATAFDTSRMVQRPGDVHQFENLTPHSFVNEGDEAHISMVVSIRTDGGKRVPWSPEGWSIDDGRPPVPEDFQFSRKKA